MSEHRFTVYVGVNISERPEDDDRTDAEYATSALWAAILRRCQDLDGYADMIGDAWIGDVELEESHD